MKESAEAGCAVLAFAKAPVPGRVKTRLVPELGEEGAAALHRRLVLHALSAATQAGIGPVGLWCAPDARHPFFTECATRFGLSLQDQGEGDLGERMERAFESALARFPRAMLVGSDIPALSPAYFREAARALATHEVVIGPAEDGGYVLVGLSRLDAGLFRDMPWGGPDVLAETRKRIDTLGLRASVLPTLWDVDRPEDLARVPSLPPAE